MPETEVQSTLPVKIQTVAEKAQVNLPLIIEKTTNAEKAMRNKYDVVLPLVQQYDGSESEEIELIRTEVNDLLVAIKNSYDVNSARRKEITEPLDEFKRDIMEHEKKVQYDGKVDNYYVKLRRVIEDIEQKRQNKRNEEIEKAKKRKALEDYKVDLTTRMKQNLANLLIERVRQVDSGSRDFFDPKNTNLQNFDERATTFRSMKAKLRTEHYDACFKIPHDALITPDEFKELVKSVMADEPYSKWNDMTNEKVLPVLNEWKGRIDSIKQEMLKVANATDEAEKKRLQEEQDKKASEEAQRKENELKAQQEQLNKNIEADAEMSKMQNSFVVQATTQTLGDEGATKKVVKFTNPELQVKALCQIIYHCSIHPKFKGFVKQKDGKPVLDSKGRPEYIEEVQKWLSFYASNCDSVVEGVAVSEDAKVTVRK